MKLVITSVVAVIFVALGSFAGVVLKSPSEASATVTDDTASKDSDDYGSDKKDDHGGDKKKAKKGGDKYDKASSSGDSAYYKFSREFVVPIMRGGQVKSLVILHISLETDSSTAEKLFSEEPKLRDNIMTTLIELSNDGRTLIEVTDVNNYETIRALILMNLKDAIDDGIKNVLIVDVAKQDL
ncbi:MAG: flagellar basal body-associated FliL family protein [Pseudomonadota bacterium]